MSDINPLTGHPFNPIGRTFSPKPDAIMMAPRKIDFININEEDEAFMNIARLSQKTKYATGDLSKDIPNFLNMKKIARMLTGMLGEDEPT